MSAKPTEASPLPPLDVPRGQTLCILQTDSVLSELQPEHGDYPDMFRALMTQAGWPDNQLTTVNVPRDGVPGSLDNNAYLITGSRLSVYEDEAWIQELATFVGRALTAGHKVIGICFGHQLLAHFFGGAVTKATAGWKVGLQRAAVVRRRPWMVPWQDEFAVLASHQDQVVRLPAAATTLAGSDGCPVAAFELGSRALAIQGHPEFRKPYSAALMQRRRAQLGEAVFEAGMASLEGSPSTSVIAQWMLRFLLAGTGGGSSR
ncbi:MAG: hypothetical protein AAGG11_01290 [Pseudomonadota bacterium]